MALLCGSRTFKDFDYFLSIEAKEMSCQVEAQACHSWGHEVASRSICSGG